MPFIKIAQHHMGRIVRFQEGLQQRALGCLRHAAHPEVNDGDGQLRVGSNTQASLQGYPPVATRSGKIVLLDSENRKT